MIIRFRTYVASWAFLFGVCPAFGANPFEDAIRKTDPLAPEQERKCFHLPPGFEAQLVASEPEIGKPMNMAFDAKGRLWMTQSREYPFPVLPVDKKGRDKIMVLEDFDAAGHARKVTTFVEGLNIPIGLYPYKDGVIAFSIPKIHFFRDTDGDGRADKDEVLLTGFDYQKDTHGLTSNFRRGYDGFIYADHGYNNNSTILGLDGSSITINSGNCYRFKPDGTHVEQHTFGQVNPFGLMFDPLGDLWSADCHSSPTYLLLHGAYYPSFGKPHDGLGFAPDVCKHSHGSTAICGMVFYDDDRFPAEYRWNTYIGNVMTCRINRDSYIEHGSTRIAKEEQDFLSSDDPWFRPVMMDLGPDGAIYVADFYNRIIGHYEVPLDHPGRDRERGRIWRIVYRGEEKQVERSKIDYTTMSASKLVAELGSPNITRRMLATDQLVDRVGTPAIKPLSKMLNDKNAKPAQKVHGLWALSRLGSLDDKTLAKLASDKDRTVRVHAMRLLAEAGRWTASQAELARKGVADPDPYVRRAATEALGRHPMMANVRPLLGLREIVPGDDEELVYASRMALRNQLSSEETFKAVSPSLSPAHQRSVADVSIAIKTETAAVFLLDHLDSVSSVKDKLQATLRHIARYAPENQMDRLREFVRERFDRDIDFQLSLFRSIQDGISQRGSILTTDLRNWGSELAERLLASVSEGSLGWYSAPAKGKESADPWFLQKRRSAGGGEEAQFICSLSPGGENLTGILRSRSFAIPPQLSFYVAGHDGFPDKPIGGKNFVRLREADTDKILASTPPPRHDTAQPVTWELKQHAGNKGYIELVDGDDGAAYAWLAVGRFEPEVVKASGMMPAEAEHRYQSAADLIGDLKIAKFEQPLEKMFEDQTAGISARSAAAKVLMKLNSSAHERQVSAVLTDIAQPQKLRVECARALAESGLASAGPIVVEALIGAPQSLQTQFALALAGNAVGAEALLATVEQGKVSPRLLQNRAIKNQVAAQLPNWRKRIENLTKALPDEDAARQKLLDQRLAVFNTTSSSPAMGAQVFKQNCAVCHSIDGQGATIGPQLDGAGNRGAERLIEDILDPSRNVDPSFRVTLFTLKNGDVESGLIRREEGETVVVADATGKERSLPKSEITARRESALSLMPDNLLDIIKPEDFNTLLAFLLSKATKAGR